MNKTSLAGVILGSLLVLAPAFVAAPSWSETIVFIGGCIVLVIGLLTLTDDGKE